MKGGWGHGNFKQNYYVHPDKLVQPLLHKQ